MAKKTKITTNDKLLPILRQADQGPSLAKVLAAASTALPITLLHDPARPPDDSALIDLTLHTQRAPAAPPPPSPGTGYGGLTPAQRAAFLAWCGRVTDPAPPAFQQLYIANLEPRLLENADMRAAALQHFHELAQHPAWAAAPWLHRARLLGAWLQQDGSRLAELLTTGLPADLISIGLGQQALLETPLTPAQLGTLLAAWKLGPVPSIELLTLRLDSLTTTLGRPPLAHARAALSDDDIAPRPWRMAHRGIRLALPQPDLRPLLETPLRDLMAVLELPEADTHLISNLPLDVPEAEAAADADSATDSATDAVSRRNWHLILEFGATRSEYFERVLDICQKMPNFTQFMDEDRRMVYRLTFRKSDMRRFWRVWEYVQGWTTTRIYSNGKELEKWKVWPHSQYL